ncbi:MAG: hypothetical protein ACJ8F1_19665 [Polyangia bacterium]
MATQVVPLQQPFVQEAAVQAQAPLLHVCPEPQGPQVPPPLPQDEALCALTATHVAPLQQPVGQVLALQTHLPALQVWPLVHACPHMPQLPVSF